MEAMSGCVGSATSNFGMVNKQCGVAMISLPHLSQFKSYFYFRFDVRNFALRMLFNVGQFSLFHI